jgi:hypothetical protein
MLQRLGQEFSFFFAQACRLHGDARRAKPKGSGARIGKLTARGPADKRNGTFRSSSKPPGDSKRDF